MFQGIKPWLCSCSKWINHEYVNIEVCKGIDLYAAGG